MVLLLWTGWGLAVPLFGLVGLVAAGLIGQIVLGDKWVDEALLWIALGLAFGGVLCQRFGRRWNDPAGDRQLVDPATGENVVLQRRSTFWFVSVERWGILAYGLAVVCILLTIVDALRIGRS
jgi:hypothetical protein